MRRKDREITDPETIERIIARCEYLRLGFFDGKQVYIVPLNYGFLRDGNQYVFYFHGAKEGRKIDLIRTSPEVGFEMDCNVEVHTAEVACRCATQFQSIIGNGHVSLVDNLEEKQHGLSLIMEHYTSRADWDIPTEAVNAVTVFKLVTDKLTCKEHE